MYVGYLPVKFVMTKVNLIFRNEAVWVDTVFKEKAQLFAFLVKSLPTEPTLKLLLLSDRTSQPLTLELNRIINSFKRITRSVGI